jgi:ketosteroid isomerase-like protein
MTPAETINAFYAAIMAKDAALIGTFYVPDEDTYVILEGPRLATKGFSKIQKGWYDFCDSALALAGIDWLEGPFVETGTDMAWVAGIVRLRVALKGKNFEQTFRATFVLKQNEGNWRIRHEHVSGVLADPYGMGDWLKPTT